MKSVLRDKELGSKIMSKNKIHFKGSVILNPVPVVLITSKNSEGKDNVFTVAWVGTVCTKPPMLSISIRPERLSYEYIKESMDFTVNIPSKELVKKVDFCGVRSGRKVDKIKEMGFSMEEGEKITAPYITDCPINIECKVRQIIPLGTHDVFIAEVVSSHVDKELMDENGKIHFEWADLISYSHGEYFSVGKNPLGSFGYSVMKDKTKQKRNITNKQKEKNSSNDFRKNKKSDSFSKKNNKNSRNIPKNK